MAAKSELLRLALTSHEARGRRSGAPAAAGVAVVLDRAARMPGRGAYLCRDSATDAPRLECFERAKRRGGITRTLRCSVKIEWSDLLESVSQ